MSNERKELLALAVTVGLVLGEDFQKNISNPNLQKLIEEKKQQTENQLKGNDNGTNTDNQENKTPLDEDTIIGIDLANGEDTTVNIPVEQLKDNEDSQDEDQYLENEMMIKRVSPCGGYKTNIKGLTEVVRRTPKVTADEVKAALKSGEPINGWTFKEVE